MDNPSYTSQAAALNRQAWDSIRRQRDEGLITTRHDVASDVLAGQVGLEHHHRDLAGQVSGKYLLDLGCGDGGELLEWARAGAHVVGVDNSPNQLAAAQNAANRLGLKCRLVLADLLDLPDDLLQAEFDIVFSSWVTAWIGDLQRWFHLVTRALKPNGIFLLGGEHPLVTFIKEQERGDVSRRSYFEEGPFIETADLSLRWNPAGDQYTTIQWQPTLSSLVTAIAQSGLRITHLLELGNTSVGNGTQGRPEEFLIRAIK